MRGRRPKRHQARGRVGPASSCLAAALLSLAAACSPPPSSYLPRRPLAPPCWLPELPATHDALSGVLGAVAGAGPRSRRDGVREEMLVGYLDALARSGPRTTPGLFPSDAHVLAYLVDAHAAWTIALGEAPKLRRLGVAALRRLPFPLDGGWSTLSALAAEVARRAPWEPRLALCLNPGWRGGPPLPVSALEGHSVDWQLAAHAELCGGASGFWELDRERKVLKVSAFTDSMWGLPAEQPARLRSLFQLVPPPAQLRQEMLATCGASLQRCTVASISLDRARLFEAAPRP